MARLALPLATRASRQTAELDAPNTSARSTLVMIVTGRRRRDKDTSTHSPWLALQIVARFATAWSLYRRLL